jgi:hypothetical protein
MKEQEYFSIKREEKVNWILNSFSSIPKPSRGRTLGIQIFVDNKQVFLEIPESSGIISLKRRTGNCLKEKFEQTKKIFEMFFPEENIVVYDKQTKKEKKGQYDFFVSSSNLQLIVEHKRFGDGISCDQFKYPMEHKEFIPIIMFVSDEYTGVEEKTNIIDFFEVQKILKDVKAHWGGTVISFKKNSGKKDIAKPLKERDVGVYLCGKYIFTLRNPKKGSVMYIGKSYIWDCRFEDFSSRTSTEITKEVLDRIVREIKDICKNNIKFGVDKDIQRRRTK